MSADTPSSGTLWGIATYFNPAGYPNKYQNFLRFRRASARQGLPLLVVEAAMGDRPYELSDTDADRVIRVHASAVLWQKERLFNLALAHLPDDCDMVVGIDTDILFDNDRWVADVSDALQRSLIVQPFMRAVQLPRDRTCIPDGTPVTDDESMPGIIAWWLANGRPSDGRMTGHTGYAVAARRSFLDRFGFYDRGIAGSGDAIMMGAFLGIPPHINQYIHLDHCPLLDHAASWSQSVADVVRGSVETIPGTVFHLWHGERKNRFYVERGALLTDFDPEQDIRIDEQGCWAWATDKPKLHARIRSYFWMRDEEAETTSLIHIRIANLEEQILYERGATQNLRQALEEAQQKNARLQAENATLLASYPGPVLHRFCTILDRIGYFLLPKHSFLRRFIRRVLLRLL